MNRPEDALIPLLAAAVLFQMLASQPLRFDALFQTAETAKPLPPALLEMPAPAPPRPVLVRDEHDHFSGAS